MECCKTKDEKIKVLELLLNDLKKENENLENKLNLYQKFILSCVSEEEINEILNNSDEENKEIKEIISLVN